MIVKEKIQKAKEYLELAERHLDKNEKRLAMGDLDHVKDNVLGCIYLLISQIQDDENDRVG